MLEEYINELTDYINKYIDKFPNAREEFIVRAIYMKAGKKFIFDDNYMPYGNKKKRLEIYRESDYLTTLNECIKSGIIICRTLSNILTRVSQNFGINIETIVQKDDIRKTPHTYNLIIPKDKTKEPYTIDLQEDLYLIKMHGFTRNFGLSYKTPSKYVISRFEQEQMDRILGYIDDENYYTDDYIYTLKADIGFFDTFKEKVRFILENIEVYENHNMSYMDRRWYHARMLENFFNIFEFNFFEGLGKIRFVDCYRFVGGKKVFIPIIVVNDGIEPDIYIYNEKESKYSKIEYIYFANAVKNGLILHEYAIKDLNKTVKELKEKQKELVR